MVFTLAAAIGLVSVAPVSAAKDSRYAAIVIDANTGETLHSSSADSRRYPASLTKMMTLYLTFEALSKGRIQKDSKVVFSKNAAAEPPTKIGVKAGGSISVESAILSLITRSANDASTALGEMIGGSEENFARMMTAKARSLGMKGTVFRNANGLPNTAQFTTARDMAKLGIALREHFPQYYSYFSTRSFAFGRQRIANHNRLLGRIKGVDGIKTGYTRASGFNLVSSVQDGNRRIVAVVLGGTSGASRDNQMAQLIKTYMPQASRRGGGDLIAKTDTPMPAVTVAKAQLPKRNAPTPDMRPEADLVEVAEASQDEAAESVEEVVAAAVPAPKPTITAAAQPKIAMASTERFGGKIPFQIRKAKDRAPSEPAGVEQAYAEQPAPAVQALDQMKTASVPSGWAIQVASSPSDGEARAILDKTAKKVPTVLADASAYTVPFEKGGVTYFRARFAGFDSKDSAWNACNALKKKKIACYAIAQ
ncbi:SPOR domain-containing protein [Aminobacter anthyllidis]|uniref:serine hydrolase n=1 Tax=Aminobacter anthyllidis TaxID=1035067 RepID=UPI0024548050|nr:serine hydrolase [Aminobacter anthyllidis]MDH4984530.1 SPOR domain-containing protein [Aminobacter anthyllidis]